MDDDQDIKKAIKDDDYLVCDLTVEHIRHYLDTGDVIEHLDELLDECQDNIHSGIATKQILILRITK